MKRSEYIGGSEIAALCGLSPWDNPTTIYLKKKGKIESKTETEQMEWGKKLEHLILEKFCERHPDFKLIAANKKLQHPQYPFIAGEADAIGTEGAEESVLVEIKTTDVYNNKQWAEEVPDHYQLQVQYYMGLAGATKSYVAVLIGKKYREYVIMPNYAMQRNLEAVAVHFWKTYIETDTMPPLTEADAETLNAIYPRETKGECIQIKKSFDFIDQIKAKQAEIKELETHVEAMKNELKIALGESAWGMVDGKYVIEWITVKRKGYVVKDTEYRQLKIKTLKLNQVEGAKHE